MTLISRTVMTDGRSVELHQVLDGDQFRYVVNDGKGTVQLLNLYNNAFSLYKVWSA